MWSRAVAVAFLAVACQSSPAAPKPTASAAPAKSAAAPDLSLPYLELVTDDAAADTPLPLIVALHGLGSRPENFVTLFEGFPAPARVVAPHSHAAFGSGFAWFAPYGPESDDAAPSIGKAADAIAAFAERAATKRPTLGKPILIGFSQGGALSYAVAVRHPSAIAASFPLSGWLPPPLWPTARPPDAPPIFAFHGTADTRVPLERDRAGAARLEALGFTVHFQNIEGAEHVIPPAERQLVFDALVAECDEQRSKGPH